MNIKWKFASAIMLAAGLAIPAQANNAQLVNQMQSCLAVIDFVDARLTPAPSHYPQTDVATVKRGLSGYKAHIQNNIVTPGLEAFAQGDKAKLEQYQTMFKQTQDGYIASLNKRYPQKRIFTDQAIAINNCAKQTVPKDAKKLEALKQALQTIIVLAKLN